MCTSSHLNRSLVAMVLFCRECGKPEARSSSSMRLPMLQEAENHLKATIKPRDTIVPTQYTSVKEYFSPNNELLFIVGDSSDQFGAYNVNGKLKIAVVQSSASVVSKLIVF